MRVLHERAPRAPLRPPGLLARLRTPARGWRRPRQQLERQRRCPRRTRGCRWLWSPLRPLHLPASSAAQPFRRAQGAGRRDSRTHSGGAPGARSRRVRLPPWTARLPPWSPGAGKQLRAANQQLPGCGGWGAPMEGVSAASPGSSFRRGVGPGNPRGRPGWEQPTPSPPLREGRGVGGTCFSRSSGSVRLRCVLRSPSPLSPRPPLLPLARASSPSPCGILHPGRGGRGGCRSEDAQGLSSSWTRAAELNGRVPASECGCRLWGRPAGALPELGCR